MIYRDSEVVVPLRVPKSDELSDKLIFWLKTAKEGEKFCYYFGPHITGQAVGRVAMRAYIRHDVILFQERSDGKFKYWAKKRMRYS